MQQVTVPLASDCGVARHQRPASIGPVSQRVLDAVRTNPGIHFRALSRAAEVSSAGQLRHHLDRLRRHGHLVELEDGGYKRFFATNAHQSRLRPGMARFSRSVPRRIGRLLLTRPMNRSELRRQLGCADSTLSYHLNRMLQSGDVARNRDAHTCRYALTDSEMVRQVLLTQAGAGPDVLDPAHVDSEPGVPHEAPAPRPGPEPDPLDPFPPMPEPPGPPVPFPPVPGAHGDAPQPTVTLVPEPQPGPDRPTPPPPPDPPNPPPTPPTPLNGA